MSLNNRKPGPVPSSHDLPVESRLHRHLGPHRPNVLSHAGHGPGGGDYLLQPATQHAGGDSLMRSLWRQAKPGLSLVPELLLQPDQMVDRAQSWNLAKWLNPDWRNPVVGLGLAVSKGLARECSCQAPNSSPRPAYCKGLQVSWHRPRLIRRPSMKSQVLKSPNPANGGWGGSFQLWTQSKLSTLFNLESFPYSTLFDQKLAFLGKIKLSTLFGLESFRHSTLFYHKLVILGYIWS